MPGRWKNVHVKSQLTTNAIFTANLEDQAATMFLDVALRVFSIILYYTPEA